MAERFASLQEADAASIEELLTFVLVGAGTVGVEMASTVAEMVRITMAKDFRHIDPTSARIVLFEAAPRVLPQYPEPLSAEARPTWKS